MRHLVLAKRYKRMLARLIDLISVLGLAAILFFAHVYPSYFDKTTYQKNRDTIVSAYNYSELYVVSSRGNYAAKCTFSYSSISDLTNRTLKHDNETFENNNLWKDLFNYYTLKKSSFSESGNLDVQGFKSSILKVGSTESNIASFDETTYTATLIDLKYSSTTLQFVLDAYEAAATVVNASPVIKNPTTANQGIIVSTVAMIIPCVAIFSIIFDLIIPLCMSHGETLGKKAFSIMVVSKDGYALKKWKLIIRWFIYLTVELILGIFTFGGMFLISYTMFLFSKNRRCLHDFLSGSAVIDKKNSYFFDSPKDEKYFMEHGGEL